MNGSNEAKGVYRQINDNQVEFDKTLTIQGLFYKTAVRHGHKLAVTDEAKMLNYQELNERTNQIAHVLQEKGIKAKKIVGIMMERSVNTIVAILGVLKSGATYVPIDPEYPEDRVRYILEDSKATLLVTEHSLLKRLAGKFDLRSLCLEGVPSSVPSHNLEYVGHAEDAAYIIYTSGSTGRPKGVIVPHQGVVNLAQAKRQYGFSETDIVLQFISHSFDASVGEIFPALLNGARLHVLSNAERQSVNLYAEIVQQTGATTGTVVPVVLNQFLHALSDEEFDK